MKLYYYILLDFNGNASFGSLGLSSQMFGSAKHAAFAASQAVASVPPVQGFTIGVQYVTAHEVARRFSES